MSQRFQKSFSLNLEEGQELEELLKTVRLIDVVRAGMKKIKEDQTKERTDQ